MSETVSAYAPVTEIAAGRRGSRRTPSISAKRAVVIANAPPLNAYSAAFGNPVPPTSDNLHAASVSRNNANIPVTADSGLGAGDSAGWLITRSTLSVSAICLPERGWAEKVSPRGVAARSGLFVTLYHRVNCAAAFHGGFVLHIRFDCQRASRSCDACVASAHGFGFRASV